MSRNLFRWAVTLGIGALVLVTDASVAQDRPRPKPVWMRQPHERIAFCVAISPDNKVVASGGFDGRVRFHTLADGKEFAAIDERPLYPRCLLYVEDGRTLFVFSMEDRGGRDKFRSTMTWYDARSRAKLRRLEFQYPVGVIKLSPDGKLLVTGSGERNDLSVKLRDPATGKVLGEVNPTNFTELTFTPDSKRIVFGNFPARVTVWDLAAKKEVLNVELGKDLDQVTALGVSPDGKTLAVSLSRHDHETLFLDLATGKERLKSSEWGEGSSGLVFVRGGKWLLMTQGFIAVVDPSTGERLLPRVPARAETTDGVAVSRDGKWLAIAEGSDCWVKVWNLDEW